MKAKLEQLIALSKIDADIDSLMEERDEIPQEIASLETEQNQDKLTFETKQTALLALEETRNQKNHTLEELKSQVEKSEKKLTEIKTNKEYHAALREIEKVKKETIQLEDEILNILGEIEVEQPKVEECQSNYETKVANFEKLICEKNEAMDQIDQKISDLKAQRSSVEASVDVELLKQYNNVRRIHDIALSQVENNACEECFTRIPPQCIIELQKGTDLISCPRCKRILYYATETQ